MPRVEHERQSGAGQHLRPGEDEVRRQRRTARHSRRPGGPDRRASAVARAHRVADEGATDQPPVRGEHVAGADHEQVAGHEFLCGDQPPLPAANDGRVGRRRPAREIRTVDPEAQPGVRHRAADGSKAQTVSRSPWSRA